MPDELALQQPSRELAQSSPMEMIQFAFNEAIKQGAAMEVVDRILEQQKWMIQHNEKEAFNAALKRIQKRLKKVPKRGFNKETKSYYALAEDVDDAVKKNVDEEGMNLTFEPRISDKPDNVLIVGCLSLGAYTKEYPLDMPADGKGAKGGGVMSRTHATGSAITYGKRYLKDMIFDLTFTKDDDGNQAGGTVSETDMLAMRDNIENAATVAELRGIFETAYKFAERIGDKEAQQKLVAAKDARKRELTA